MIEYIITILFVVYMTLIFILLSLRDKRTDKLIHSFLDYQTELQVSIDVILQDRKLQEAKKRGMESKIRELQQKRKEQEEFINELKALKKKGVK